MLEAVKQLKIKYCRAYYELTQTINDPYGRNAASREIPAEKVREKSCTIS